MVLKVLFLKKPQAIDLNFLNPHQGISDDDKSVNRTSRHFFHPMLCVGSGEVCRRIQVNVVEIIRVSFGTFSIL